MTPTSATGSAPAPGRATVEVSYRLDGWDAQPTRVETRVVFAPSGDQDLIAGVGGGGDRTPLWMTGPVTPVQSGRALVVARGDDGRALLDLARQALVDVAPGAPRLARHAGRRGPRQRGRSSTGCSAAPAGQQYANIAAVTAAVDGSLVPGVTGARVPQPEGLRRPRSAGRAGRGQPRVAPTWPPMPPSPRCRPGCSRASPTTSRSPTPGIPVATAACPDPRADPEGRPARPPADRGRPRPDGARPGRDVRGGLAGDPLRRPRATASPSWCALRRVERRESRSPRRSTASWERPRPRSCRRWRADLRDLASNVAG